MMGKIFVNQLGAKMDEDDEFQSENERGKKWFQIEKNRFAE